MAITDAQRARLRRLIGDTGSTQAFTDAELDTIFSDSGDDLEIAVVECFDVLLADAAKRVTYRQGQSMQDDNKLFEHLLKLRDQWAERAGVGKGAIETGVLTYAFYDEDGTDIPPDDDDDDYGWLL